MDGLNAQPLSFAIANGDSEVFKALMEFGAAIGAEGVYSSPEPMDQQDQLCLKSPFQRAVELDRQEMAPALLSARPELADQRPEHDGNKVLSVPSVKMLPLLINAGCSMEGCLFSAVRELIAEPNNEEKAAIFKQMLNHCLTTTPLSKMSVDIEEISTLALVGLEPLAFKLLERLNSDGVDFEAKRPWGEAPLRQKALEKGWRAGGVWMEAVRDALRARAELSDFLPPVEAAQSKPVAKRRGL